MPETELLKISVDDRDLELILCGIPKVDMDRVTAVCPDPSGTLRKLLPVTDPSGPLRKLLPVIIEACFGELIT